MFSRSRIVCLSLVFCLGGLPAATSAKKVKKAVRPQGQPLTMSTTRVNQPSGGTVFNLKGTYTSGGRVVTLRTVTVKGPTDLISIGSRSSQEEEYQPQPDYAYSNSDMSQSDGSVMIAATYQFDEATNRNLLNMTVGGVTITLNLNTLEMMPITPVDQQRLEEWANSEEAALALETLMAIVAQGWNQPFEVLQNFYALAVLFETGSDSSVGMQPKGSRKVVLHHAVRRLKSPNNAMSQLCSEQTFAAVNTFGDPTASSALMRMVTPQGYQCCGWGDNCIRDRYNAPIYGAPCVNHDRCVAGQHIRSAVRCAPSLARAVLYVWWRNSEWTAYMYYDR